MKEIKRLMDTTGWVYTVVSDERSKRMAKDDLCMYLDFGEHTFSIYRREDDMIVVMVDACKSIALRSVINILDVIEMCLQCMDI